MAENATKLKVIGFDAATADANRPVFWAIVGAAMIRQKHLQTPFGNTLNSIELLRGPLTFLIDFNYLITSDWPALEDIF